MNVSKLTFKFLYVVTDVNCTPFFVQERKLVLVLLAFTPGAPWVWRGCWPQNGSSEGMVTLQQTFLREAPCNLPTNLYPSTEGYPAVDISIWNCYYFLTSQAANWIEIKCKCELNTSVYKNRRLDFRFVHGCIVCWKWILTLFCWFSFHEIPFRYQGNFCPKYTGFLFYPIAVSNVYLPFCHSTSQIKLKAQANFSECNIWHIWKGTWAVQQC